MPRIRTIKPEFWADEKLAPLDPTDRLVFLGLISLSDDFGRVHDNVKVIDAFIFPECSRTSRESLAKLSRMGRIRRGKSSSGKRIIEVTNWEKHQRVDKPQRATALPEIVDICDENGQEMPQNASETIVRESFANDSGTVPGSFATLSGIRDQGSGTRDQGAREKEQRPPTPPNGRDQVLIPEEIRNEWGLFQDHFMAVTGRRLGAPQAQAMLMELGRRGWDKARRDLLFTMQKGGKSILDSDNDYEKRSSGSGARNQRNGKSQPMSEIIAEALRREEASV